jgi:hypothetical protein
MITAIPTAPCMAPYGDYLLALAIRNKQDYARLNSYELHVLARAADPQHTQPGPWQKVAQIQKVQKLIPLRWRPQLRGLHLFLCTNA